MRPPDIRLWQRDETRYWCDKLVLASCSPLIGRYLVDRHRAVHMCSFSLSYEFWVLDTEPGRQAPIYRFRDEDFADSLRERIREGDAQTEACNYWEVREVELLRCPVVYAPSMAEWEEFLDDLDDRRYWQVRVFDHCRELLQLEPVEAIRTFHYLCVQDANLATPISRVLRAMRASTLEYLQREARRLPDLPPRKGASDGAGSL